MNASRLTWVGLWSMAVLCCQTDKFHVDDSLLGSSRGASQAGAPGERDEDGDSSALGGAVSGPTGGGAELESAGGAAVETGGSAAGGTVPDPDSTGAGGSPGWVGDRVGPTLADVDVTLGGLNADLPEPASCEDLLLAGCAHFTGTLGGTAISGTCSIASYDAATKILTCSADGFGLWFRAGAFSGNPPSNFNFNSDSGMHAIGFSADSPAFASHVDDKYVIDADYEQTGARAAGVRYYLDAPDGEKPGFISMVFAVRFVPRPTCSTCREVRIRGSISAPTGFLP